MTGSAEHLGAVVGVEGGSQDALTPMSLHALAYFKLNSNTSDTRDG